MTTGLRCVLHLPLSCCTWEAVLIYYLLKRLTGVQGAASALCDVVVTVTLCYLYRAHSSTSHRYAWPSSICRETGTIADPPSRVDSIVDRLVVYAINRAAATRLALSPLLVVPR